MKDESIQWMTAHHATGAAGLLHVDPSTSSSDTPDMDKIPTCRFSKTQSPLRGFTLVEMMVVVVIVGILVASAVPMFHAYVARREINAEISALAGAFTLARSKSRNGTPVTICPTSNPDAIAPTCSNGGGTLGWASGWIIFLDYGAPNTFSAGVDTILLKQNAFPGSGGITSAVANYTIRFLPNGQVIGAANSFTFKPKGDENNAAAQKTMTITFQGTTKLN